jgi:hypothetical protein
VSHNYSLPTIKTLFGQASHCAYPECREPLIFEDRNAKTVVAEIAHIRSEKFNGPRHDPTFTGDINGPENLLLLCGKHHPPVDRHESIYSIEELLIWKRVQVASAGSGTPISAQEAERFTGVTQEERQAMAQLARLAARVASACSATRRELNRVEVERRRALDTMRLQYGPMYEIDEAGNDVLDENGRKVNLADRMQMSHSEEARWKARREAALQAGQPQIEAALNALDEEVNVLRMMTPSIGEAANVVLLMAQGAADVIMLEEAMDQGIKNMHAALRSMWVLANPDG